MHAFSSIALPMFGLGILGAAYVLYRKFFFNELIYTDHLPMFLTAITAILVSFTLFSIGFLGELMVKWNSTKR
jgi:hypothetical protein